MNNLKRKPAIVFLIFIIFSFPVFFSCSEDPTGPVKSSPRTYDIAFLTKRDGFTNTEIYVMDSTGENQINLTNNPENETDFSWSPDGSLIAFTRNGVVWVMNADGSGQVSLAAGHSPQWSPDGSKIAFQSYRDGNHEIYIMNDDGSDQINLTNNETIDSYFSWSPDGS